MAWYAYCLTEQQTLNNGTRARRPYLLEGIQGVNGAPVLSYPSGEFAVVVSEYDREFAGESGDSVKLDERVVLEHARVVSVCFRTGTVLPFRFGTIFDTDDALRQAVRANRRAFGQSVARLRGKAEMHLKVLVRDGVLRGALDDVQIPERGGWRVSHQVERKGFQRPRAPDQGAGAFGSSAQVVQSIGRGNQLQAG